MGTEKLVRNIPDNASTGLVEEPPVSGGSSSTSDGGTGGDAGGGSNPDDLSKTGQTQSPDTTTQKADNGSGDSGDGSGDSADEKLAKIKAIQEKPDDQRTDEEVEALSTYYGERAEEISNKEEVERTEEEKTFLKDYQDAVRQQSVVYRLAERYGLEGDFEDSEEGLMAASDKVRQDALNEGVNQFLEERPLVKELAEHLDQGKSLETFMKKNEGGRFKDLTIDEKNLDQVEQVYRDALQAKGNSKEEIDALVDTAKASEKLVERAKNSLKDAQVREQAEIDATLAQEEAALQAQREQAAALDKEMQTLIKGGKILGHVIPQGEINSFYDYLTKPIGKDGNGNEYTQSDVDWSKLSLEQRLFLDRLVHLNFKMKGIGGTAIKLQGTKTIKFGENKAPRINMGSEGGSDGSSSSKGVPKFASDPTALRNMLQQVNKT